MGFSVCFRWQFSSEAEQLAWATRHSQEEWERRQQLEKQEQADLEMAIALSKADNSRWWEAVPGGDCNLQIGKHYLVIWQGQYWLTVAIIICQMLVPVIHASLGISSRPRSKVNTGEIDGSQTSMFGPFLGKSTSRALAGTDGGAEWDCAEADIVTHQTTRVLPLLSALCQFLSAT